MTEKLDILVEGGKATPGPPLGPALGPLGINVIQVVNAINEKTKAFTGMKVPVTVLVDSKTREFEIKVDRGAGIMTPNFKGKGSFANLPRTQDSNYRKILERSDDLFLKLSLNHACILKDYILICKDKLGVGGLTSFRWGRGA